MNEAVPSPDAAGAWRDPSAGEVDVSAGRGSLTVLISTHDRVDLLERTLRFLDAARRPPDWTIIVLVVANACSDGTHAFLRSRTDATTTSPQDRARRLPVRWIAEPMIGKSRALNRAMPEILSDLVAFVDDDHRVDDQYLGAVCDAAIAYPDADIFCGRILPDWDGTEPAWVHETGAYRIYPLPVPRYDLGANPLSSPEVKGIPGGGNLIVRSRLLRRVGEFAMDYGPRGHDLAGGEDQEWVRRALAQGARIQYVPSIVQHHYVDHARLKLAYLLRKAYERSASVARMSAVETHHRFVPRFLFGKAARHSLHALTSFSQRRRRFHLVRTAASLGEIKGHLQGRTDIKKRSEST